MPQEEKRIRKQGSINIIMGSATFLEILLAIVLPPVGVFFRYGIGVYPDLLCGGGIAKGIRRVTAVTTNSASKALELALSLEQEVNEASKTEGSSLEQV
ncbi:unnamed protein product [Camellia sinensis]